MTTGGRPSGPAARAPAVDSAADSAAGSAGARFLKLGAGEAIARLLSFGATIYLARLLGADTYGAIVFAHAILLYLTFGVGAGMDLLGTRAVGMAGQDVRAFIEEVLGARLLMAAVVAAAVLAVRPWLPHPDGNVLAAYAGTLAAAALQVRWVHVGIDRAGTVAWVRVLTECVAALVLVTVVSAPRDVLRVPLVQIGAESIAALLLLLALPAALRPRRLRLAPTATLRVLRASWPTIVHGLLGLAIFNSDFVFLRVLADREAVGFYAVAYTLVSFFQNLGTAYTMSLIPGLGANRARGEPLQPGVDTAMAHVSLVGLPVAVGGMLVAPALLQVFYGAAYLPGAAALQVLLFVVPVSLVRNVMQAVLIAGDRQDLMLRSVAWAAAANVALNLLLIPAFGMVGAALATVCTEAVRSTLAVWYARRLGVAPTPLRRLRLIALAALVMAAVVLPMREQAAWFTVPLGGIVYVIVLAVGGGIQWSSWRRPQLRV